MFVLSSFFYFIFYSRECPTYVHILSDNIPTNSFAIIQRFIVSLKNLHFHAFSLVLLRLIHSFALFFAITLVRHVRSASSRVQLSPCQSSTGELITLFQKYKQKASKQTRDKFHNRCIHSLHVDTAHSVPSYIDCSYIHISQKYRRRN